MLLAIKKIRDAYRKRMEAQSVTMENPSDHAIPMYDMSQMQAGQPVNDQVQVCSLFARGFFCIFACFSVFLSHFLLCLHYFGFGFSLFSALFR
jgi:hypothetical protein